MNLKKGMGFKEFYLKRKDQELFENTFEKFYRKGHFGNVDKNIIKNQQKDWYNKLKNIIEEKDFDALVMSLGHRDNKVSRELFSKLTSINIKKKTTKMVRSILDEFCSKELMEKENKLVAAGLLMYRIKPGNILEVFIAKPGIPFFKNKDLGVWTIPKGKVERGEDLKLTAIREFQEEVGFKPNAKNLIPLGSVKRPGFQSDGGFQPTKIIHGWAFEGDGRFRGSNTIGVEWPPGSGKTKQFPEIDTAKFFDTSTAMKKLSKAQSQFVERLVKELDL